MSITLDLQDLVGHLAECALPIRECPLCVDAYELDNNEKRCRPPVAHERGG